MPSVGFWRFCIPNQLFWCLTEYQQLGGWSNFWSQLQRTWVLGKDEINLITLDEAGKQVICAEMKSQASKFDEEKLRRKAQAFFDVHGDNRLFDKVFLRLTPQQGLEAAYKVKP